MSVMTEKSRTQFTLPRTGLSGSYPGAMPGVGLTSGGRALANEPDQTDQGSGPCGLGGSQGQNSRSNRQLPKLACGTWNVTPLGGKEPELVCKVEMLTRYNWARLNA